MTRLALAMLAVLAVLAAGSCRLEEDHHAWSCSSMGNLSCGAL